ncbi:type II-A CRISPR-associated protein Csn2 [Limosilactobacillus sp.]|jgi:CRISPR type II-A-associated protein Csn2|uniref:type II-A CRISPR-associated protein Csn2 n=1 Tax=Limosilactobacillus sp. TaxID=2773925 RepID=UPI0025C635CF|nr:type II-A CRISPR-associated protein Csn2 [Limosilactobacillus sp.]MCH3922894.1 type II-A CRISPR-associated protein Csn2 [Limosilactobacillus sp.]MCH3927577.1 type II-A CRISPR-associated protein Csn2 [Limosilactobacillus sp.]
MILSYKSHQPIEIKSGKISVIGTNSPEIYTELINGLQDFNDELTLTDDVYQSLEIKKFIDFDSVALLTHKLLEKYSKDVINAVVKSMTEESQNRVNDEIRQLYSVLQEALFMTDLPLEIQYDGELKRLLSYCHMKLAFNNSMKPYDIIINDLKIHLECDLKSVVCLNNVANYLSKAEFGDLLVEVQAMNLPLLLVEFTELKQCDFYQNAEGLFIDQDFVDWKL